MKSNNYVIFNKQFEWFNLITYLSLKFKTTSGFHPIKKKIPTPLISATVLGVHRNEHAIWNEIKNTHLWK